MTTTEDIIGRYTRVNGTRVHYDELGEGIPLVLIHTLYACSLEWTTIMPMLADRGFHCIAIDLPGNARSYPPNWTPLASSSEFGDFIADFITTGFGEQKVLVAGTSIGGNITIDLALRHSDKLLGAIAMEGAIFTPTAPVLDALVHPAAFPSGHDLIERAVTDSLAPGTDPEIIAELVWQHRFTGHAAGMPQILAWAKHDLRSFAGPVACPLLVLHGEYDFYLPQPVMDLTKELIPNCEVRRLAGIGHYPMIEDPQGITQIIAEFAANHVKTG
ncbi:MAG TPA: alpha/beta hydrolase [Mycobacterium sp.]|nr:alpha/beta hydrolase [Mycobacterium sp.]